jgi:hypothetical protein
MADPVRRRPYIPATVVRSGSLKWPERATGGCRPACEWAGLTLVERDDLSKHHATTQCRSAAPEWQSPVAAARRITGCRPAGKRSEGWAWRLLGHESDSAGVLAGRHESGDRQAPLRPIVGTGVAPEFVPKQNCELSGSRGPCADDAARLGHGEWEVRGDGRAKTRFHFRTRITSVVPWLVVSGTGSPRSFLEVVGRDSFQS